MNLKNFKERNLLDLNVLRLVASPSFLNKKKKQEEKKGGKGDWILMCLSCTSNDSTKLKEKQTFFIPSSLVSHEAVSFVC